MARNDENDVVCQRIKQNLEDYDREREEKRRHRAELQAMLMADKEELLRLRVEEGLVFGQIAISIPTTAVSPLGAAAAFHQLNSGAQDLARVWAEIEAKQLAIKTSEGRLDELERRIAELTRLIAQSWDTLANNHCEYEFLPLDVPRN